MQDINSFLGDPTLANQMLLGVLKLLFLLGGGLYVVFAIVVVRQIRVMRKTLITTFSPLLTSLGLVHLAAAILVLLIYWFGL